MTEAGSVSAGGAGESRDYTVAGPEDQIVQFGHDINFAEDVERPVAHGTAAQVRMMKTAPEKGLQMTGDTRCLLLGLAEW